MPAFVEVMESPGYMDGIDVSDSSKIQGYDFLTFETHIFYWSQL